MTQKFVKVLVFIFVSICFATFIILFNFNSLLYNPDFVSGLLENKDAIEPTNKLINYFQNTGDLPDIFKDQREINHLKDVKSAINFYTIVLFILFLVCLSYILLSKKENTRRMLKLGCIFLFLFAFLLVVLPFTPLFQIFHQVLFTQGSWLFAQNSVLIQFYPLTFFQAFAKNIILSSLITALFVFLPISISKHIS